MKNILYILLIGATLASCVSGGMDKNPQLDELNNALAFAPKIEDIHVNGTAVERNDISVRQVEAKAGDVLKITTTLKSGQDASLAELEFFRRYYGTEDDTPVEDGTDGLYTLSGGESAFEFDFTVPALDDDGHDFHAGDVITIWLRVRNTRDNFGYREIVVHYSE